MFKKGFLALALLCTFEAIAVPINLKEPARYRKFKASEKQNYLWGRILLSKYKWEKLPTKWENLRVIKSLFYKYSKPAFLHHSDFKKKAPKILHRYGSIAKVELVITNKNKYTGILNSGAIGIARLSRAFESKDSFTPGMALKFFIDGKQSINTHVMASLDGQGSDLNFFSNPMSNVIPRPRRKILKIGAKLFERTIKKLRKNVPESDRGGSAFMRPITRFHQWDRFGKKFYGEDGKPVKHIIFNPTKAGKSLDRKDKRDLRMKLAEIRPGTILYDVIVDDNNPNKPSTTAVKIGHLILKSEFVPSWFGDEVINFQLRF